MGKKHPTGLKDNPLGRKIAMQMLEKLYTDFLVSGGALPLPSAAAREGINLGVCFYKHSNPAGFVEVDVLSLFARHCKRFLI